MYSENKNKTTYKSLKYMYDKNLNHLGFFTVCVGGGGTIQHIGPTDSSILPASSPKHSVMFSICFYVADTNNMGE